MKKIISLLAIAVLALAGCGSATTYVGNSDITASGEFVNADGDTTTASLTVTQEGDIIGAEFDASKGDITSKKEASETGDYVLGNDGGLTWGEQVASVEEYVVANDAFPTLDAEGKDVDAVTSATIGLSDLNAAFDAAMSTLESSAEYYTVTYTKDGEDITEATFNVVSVDGSYDKIALATSGEYDMGSEVPYQDQIADLENYVVENDAFPELDGTGSDAHAVDGQTTATIKLGSYAQAFDNAVAE